MSNPRIGIFTLTDLIAVAASAPIVGASRPRIE
jgi:hypothetical protein